MILVTTLIICVLVSYETLARKKGYPMISTGLEEIRNYSLTFWTLLGNWVSRFVNFWWIFENLWDMLKEVLLSFMNIFKPLIQTGLSFSYFLVGFVNVRNVLVSVLVVGGIGYVFLYNFLYNLIINLTRRNLIVFSNLTYSVLCFFPNFTTDCLHNIRVLSTCEKKVLHTIYTFFVLYLCTVLNFDTEYNIFAIDYLVPTIINVFFSTSVFVYETIREIRDIKSI